MAKYVFPASLESIKSKDIKSSGHPFIHLSLYEWNTFNRDEQKPTSKPIILDQYFLAIPETTIQEQYNHGWENFLPVFTGGDMVQKMKSFVSDVAKKIPLVGDSVVTQAENYTGKLVNDFVRQNYTGLDFRQFEFLFNMIPKNHQEAETIYKIMTSLKKYTTPDYSTSWKVKYPAVVKFAIYSTDKNDALFRSMFCGVTTLGFNYTPSGFMRTFKDGFPVQIHMNLSLKELKRVNHKELMT